MKTFVLDIESFAITRSQILSTIPPWDLEEAKSRIPGSYKKEATINEWLENDRLNHGKDLIEKVALYPEYATTAIVGLMGNGGVRQFYFGNPEDGDLAFSSEAVMLEIVWDALDQIIFNGDIITGYFIKGFDLPFLIKRSWLLGVPVPSSIFNPIKQYPLSAQIIDLREVWAAGRRDDLGKRVKLQDVLKACNLPLKTGDGSEFANLWETDRAAALAYNRNDLEVEHALAERLGVVQKSRLASPSLIAAMEEEVPP